MSAVVNAEEKLGRPADRRFSLRRIQTPYALIALVLLLVVWQFGTALFGVPEFILPKPAAIAADIAGNIPYFVPNIGTTSLVILIGFIASLVVGLPIAVMLAYSKALNRSIYPLIVGSQVVPKVAIAPLMTVWFGFGLSPKVAIVITIAFFPVVVNTVVGLRSVPPQLIYLGQSMGASAWQIFWKFCVPHALPSMLAGAKMAAVLAVIGAVVAEFVGADSGLGYVILAAASNFDVTRQFSAIVLLSIVGLIFFWLIELIERWLIPWHVSMRRD